MWLRAIATSAICSEVRVEEDTECVEVGDVGARRACGGKPSAATDAGGCIRHDDTCEGGTSAERVDVAREPEWLVDHVTDDDAPPRDVALGGLREGATVGTGADAREE